MLGPRLLLLLLAPLLAALDVCRLTFGSSRYDLNRLNGLTLLGGDASFRYALSPCSPVPTEQCGTNTQPFEAGMMACQERVSPNKFESPMGFLNGYGKSPDVEFKANPQGEGTGVLMIVRNALCNGGERLVQVTFICDPSANKPKTMNVSEAPICTFTITVKAAEACPLTSGSSISGGTVFLIVLLVIVVVYLLGGVLYNRLKAKQTGLEMLPHRSFWLLLLGLFVDGCRTTLTFVRTCGGKNSYASV